MEFASKCVYDYGGYSSEENMNEDDEFQSSPLANQNPAPPPPPVFPASPRIASSIPIIQSGATQGVKKLKKVRKSDTNVISVKFDCLEEKTFTTTAQPIKCENCSAVMTVLETVLNNLDSGNASKMKWLCVFCGHANKVSAERLNNPRNADMLFMPEGESCDPDFPKECTDKEAEGENKKVVDKTDESALLFTIDISGSMGCTVAMSTPSTAANSDSGSDSDDDNTSNTTPARRPQSGGLFAYIGRAVGFQSASTRPVSQRTNRQRPSHRNTFQAGLSNTQYVTRLDATKTALVNQISDLKTNKPNVKLGVVTFCTEVEYMGDGNDDKRKKLNPDCLNDKNAIQREGMKCQLPGPVSDSAKTLKRAILQMNPLSMTALGPALLYSVAIAGQKNGSKVIMCTDGMANVGIGTLDNSNRDDEFYTYVAEYANELGVTVSVLAIEGSEVGLASLGQVADLTNGAVNIVKSTSLGNEYSGIVSQRIVGSRVEVTLILHSSLYIRDQLNSTDKSRSTKTLKIGNVSADTENFFEFGFKPRDSKPKNPKNAKSSNDEHAEECSKDKTEPSGDVALNVELPPENEEKKSEVKEDEVKELPFQLQITYTNRHNVKMTRIITKKMPCTRKREDAEKDVNVALLGAHSVQNCAAISKEREYTKARKEVLSKQKFMSKFASSLRREEELGAISQANACLMDYGADIYSQQAEEMRMDLNLSENDSDDVCDSFAKEAKQKQKKAVRMKRQTDKSANVMFKNAKVNSKSFFK